jgi:hypothetical protein
VCMSINQPSTGTNHPASMSGDAQPPLRQSRPASGPPARPSQIAAHRDMPCTYRSSAT